MSMDEIHSSMNETHASSARSGEPWDEIHTTGEIMNLIHGMLADVRG
jgi:hypothetical protein